MAAPEIKQVHDEPTTDARTGRAYYFTYRTPHNYQSFRVVEIASGVNLTHEDAYFVSIFRDRWETVVGEVRAANPRIALRVALEVLNLETT